MDCTIREAKTKALIRISFAVTAKLICVFVFAYAKSRFSQNEAHFRASKLSASKTKTRFKPRQSMAVKRLPRSPVCHIGVNGIKPGSYFTRTDKHAALYSKLRTWAYINL